MMGRGEKSGVEIEGEGSREPEVVELWVVNRSMFTKSDRSVGLGGTDDWCVRLPTDMMIGQKEVNFWVRSCCGMERGKAGERDEQGRQLKCPISETHDISNHGGPRHTRLTDTDSALLSPSALFSPSARSCARHLCVLYSAIRCHCSHECRQFDVTFVCACPKIDISATWLPPLSLQAHPSPVIKTSKIY